MNHLNPNLRLQHQQQLQLPVLSPPNAPPPQRPFVAREIKEGSRWNSKKFPTSAGFLQHPCNHSYVVCHKFWSIMHLAGAAAAVTRAASRLNLSGSSIRDLQTPTIAKSIQGAS
jgi:hypothetical protein